MMSHATVPAGRWGWIRQTAIFLVFTVGVVVLLLALAGKFTRKVSEIQPPKESASASRDYSTVPVRLVRLPRVEPAAGTVRAVYETTIGSKLLARAIEVNLKAGQTVKQGDVLVRLDDTDLRAKLQQAVAAVASAEALRNQAEADQRRAAQLVQSKTISRQAFDQAEAALRTAEAEVQRARAAAEEVRATLDWTVIRSPIDGTIVDKKIQVGDMVVPGQQLATLFDPTRMQLVAGVRESLASRLRVGQPVPVRIEGLSKQCVGTISEIVPEAESASRTFQVKVTGPCPPGIYSGMFGRIGVPLDDEELLVMPRRAVRNVGQLEQVDVVENGRIARRSVRIGRALDAEEVRQAGLPEGEEYVEVLSGLREGEAVVMP